MTIEAGKYSAKAKTWTLGESSNGKEMLEVVFAITSPGPYQGMTITARLFFTEKTFDRTVESLRYMGWKGDDLAKIEGLTSEVEIDVGHEEYQGETQVRVKWVNRLKGGGTAKALDAGKTKSFAERMKARVAMADAARSAKEAMNGNATPALGATGSDEKLPF
jgi:hypothetical protein